MTAAMVGLVGVWGLWLVAVLSQPHLVGWAFIASDVMIGLGLLTLRIQDSNTIRLVLRQVGLGFCAVALADLWWTLAFPSGEAPLGDTLGVVLVYALSSVLTAAAAWLLYVYVRSLLGLSYAWLWTALGAGFAMAVCTFVVGSHSLHAHQHTPLDFVVHCLNTTLAGVGAFASALFILMGRVTFGGSFSRWVIPASVGFSLILVGDILYSAQGEDYRFGSVADWSYMLGNSMFFLYFLQGLKGRLRLERVSEGQRPGTSAG
jgi:hypothetical protein